MEEVDQRELWQSEEEGVAVRPVVETIWLHQDLGQNITEGWCPGEIGIKYSKKKKKKFVYNLVVSY